MGIVLHQTWKQYQHLVERRFWFLDGGAGCDIQITLEISSCIGHGPVLVVSSFVFIIMLSVYLEAR